MIASILFSILAWYLTRRLSMTRPAAISTIPDVAIAVLLLLPIVSFLPKIEWAFLPAAPTSSAMAGGWEVLLCAAWSVGAAGCLIRLCLSLLRLRRWHRESLLVRAGRYPVRELSGLSGPVAAGIWRRTVLVPPSFREWPRDRQDMALAHEFAHLDRHDPLKRLLAETCCAIHWFNPFVRLLARQQALQSEFACDAAVVRSTAPRNYARFLLEAATPGPLVRIVAPMAADPGSLERRIVMLSGPDARSSRALPFAMATAAALAVAAALVRPPSPGTDSPSPTPSLIDAPIRLSAEPFPLD